MVYGYAWDTKKRRDSEREEKSGAMSANTPLGSSEESTIADRLRAEWLMPNNLPLSLSLSDADDDEGLVQVTGNRRRLSSKFSKRMGSQAKLLRSFTRVEPQTLSFVIFAGCFLISMALLAVSAGSLVSLPSRELKSFP